MAGLFLVKDNQNIAPDLGNEVLNVYGYLSTLAVINEPFELATAFIAQVIPAVIACQSSVMIHESVEVIQLDGTGYHLRVLTGGNVGTRGPDYDAFFTCWGFELIRAALGQRSGGKRIGLVADPDVDNGFPVPAMAAPLGAAAAAFAAPLHIALIDTWFPVILERPHPPSTVWGQHAMSGAVYKRVTTQNSRKR